MQEHIYYRWRWKWVIGGFEIKEYTFIYKHHNGADVYESATGEKYIKFDDLVFRTIGEVNKYIRENHVRLNQEKNKEQAKQNDPRHLTNDDWKMLKGE